MASVAVVGAGAIGLTFAVALGGLSRAYARVLLQTHTSWPGPVDWLLLAVKAGRERLATRPT
jgi:2-polyprenyl-6-methoxyphenol hydroxylase-like FAD-dependent oxidoreductase